MNEWVSYLHVVPGLKSGCIATYYVSCKITYGIGLDKRYSLPGPLGSYINYVNHAVVIYLHT